MSSPMTRKKFVLSKCLGGIERNSSGYITGAEATTILYGVRFNPELNAKEGRLVSSKAFLKYQYQLAYLLSLFTSIIMSCVASR